MEKNPGGHAKLSHISVIVKLQTIAVEKNQKKLLFSYRIALLFLVFLILEIASTQKLQTVKGYCGMYYRSMDDLYRQKQAELDFYQFIPGQVVASIGARCGHWEAAFAASTDHVEFYLQAIDTVYFNDR